MSARRRTRLQGDALDLLQAIAVRVEAARRLASPSTDALLTAIVEATVALFQAEAASIALFDPVSGQLVFRVAAGEQGRPVVGLSIPPDQGLVGYVYSTGQALALSDVERDSRFGRKVAEKTAYIPRSIVAVPLVDEHGTIGVLEVLDKRDEATFSLRDIELAGVFARQAAVAISATRVERDTALLLARALEVLATGDQAAESTVAEIVEAATAELERDDESRLWRLAAEVARLRDADPDRLDLVTELLAVLTRHASRRRDGRRRGGRAPAT